MLRTSTRVKQKSPLLKASARVFHALADENRLFILALLAEHGEMNVTQLGRELNQSQPSISHHLTRLRAARLIDYRREGKFNFYKLNEEGIAATIDLLFADGRFTFAGLELQVRKK